MKQEVGIIVQARMGSTRLPGKVLLNLDENDRVLDVLIKRLKCCKLVNEIIIATTPNKRDSLIIESAKTHNVSFFIGSEENVLERYYLASKVFNLDIIIRATSDNPFVDPKILDDMIAFYKTNTYDYIKNSNFPIGLGVEIFNFKTLEKIYLLAKTNPEKEHVTYFIEMHPEMFKIYCYNIENIKSFNKLRLTIDEEEDLRFCRKIYDKLKKKGKKIDFSIFDIIEIIEENPKLMNINKNIKQKNV